MKDVIEQIKKHEGFESKVYTCPAGKLTIGYGRNLENNGISKDEAEFLLKNDVLKIEEALKQKLADFYNDLPIAKQAVLINMSYNLGISGLLGFKNMLLALKNKDYQMAKIEMLNSKWAKQVKNRANELAEIIGR